MNKGVIIVIIILLICCFISSSAGAYWYSTQKTAPSNSRIPSGSPNATSTPTTSSTHSTSSTPSSSGSPSASSTPSTSNTPSSSGFPSASSTPSTASPSNSPASTSTFCYRYATNPMRTLFYKADGTTVTNCDPQWGWGYNDSNLNSAGGSIKGFTTQQPNTDKYCYRYATNPLRTLFYKVDGTNVTDCNANWGWGHNDSNLNSAGGEVYLYSTEQPNTDKYCYRYAANPMRTLFYKVDGTNVTNCNANWGWGHNDSNLNSAGGEVWIPK